MKDIITIVEGLLYAIMNVKGDKVSYYLKGIEHFESGKTFTFIQFITENDYKMYREKFSNGKN